MFQFELAFISICRTVNFVTFRIYCVTLSFFVMLNKSSSNIKLSAIAWEKSLKCISLDYLIQFNHQNAEFLKRLPKINFFGAQTSNVSFENALMRQWYSYCSSRVSSATNLLHFFCLAALSHSSLEVGHDLTIFMSVLSWHLDTY